MGRFMNTFGAACAAAAVMAAPASAQGILPDRATNVTISAPIALPGVVLPAGTYLFRLADSQATRHVVQVFDKDRTKIYATLLTVAAERYEPSDDAVITFRETAVNDAPALRFWYYAGEKSGHEFVYPKEQAMKIAQSSGQSVLAVESASSDIEDMKKGEISRVEPAAAEQAPPAAPTAPAAAEPAPAPAATPAQPAMPQSETMTRPEAAPAAPVATTGSMPSAQTQPAGTSGTAPAEAPATRTELPRTASALPLAGLAGLLALGAAAGARALRRRL